MIFVDISNYATIDRFENRSMIAIQLTIQFKYLTGEGNYIAVHYPRRCCVRARARELSAIIINVTIYHRCWRNCHHARQYAALITVTAAYCST